MAGGFHPKSSSHRPPSTSSASTSASARKSRWESSAAAAAASNFLNRKDPSSDPKSNNAKPPPKPMSHPNPSPRPTTPRLAAAELIPPQAGAPFPFPDFGPPPLPTYGFHMLERRTIALADGSLRSYFALPPDYQDFPLRPPLPLRPPRFHPMGPGPDIPPAGPRFPTMSPEGLGLRDKNQNPNSSAKRKFGGEEELKHGNNPNGFYPVGSDYRSDFAAGTSSSFKRDVSDERAGKYMRNNGGSTNNTSVGLPNKHLEIDQKELKKAFLNFVKLIYENEAERKRYLEDGKHGRLQCLACGRSSKDFPDIHALILHTYNSDNANMSVDHLGLHKALCVSRGWNYSKPPDNSKAYQFLPADEAAANQDDLIMWPPMVIIHNTITGKGKDGRMEGLGNKAMDNKIRDLGFAGGKSKTLYGRDGHLGITLIKFSGDQSGLKEAVRLGEHLEKENHGRKAWEHMQPVTLGKEDEKNPNLVKVERNGEKKRILYGYLGTVADLSKVDFDTRKKVKIESQREFKASK